MIKEIALADIRIDGGTQQRFEIDEVTVQQYASRMRAGSVFPPIDVVFDGASYFLVDGFHRHRANLKLGKTIIEAEVSTGTRREAIWMSLTVNQEHGLRMNSQDVHKMLMRTVFPDAEWSNQTDIAIAELIGFSASYVSKKRREYADFVKAQSEQKPETKPEDEEEKEPDAPTEPEPEPAVVDELGKPVPKHLESVFNRRPEIKQHIKEAMAIVKTVKDAVLKNDPLYCNCKVEQLKSHMSNFRSVLRFTLPYAVCPYCGGDENNQECKACEQHGFVNEATYLATPKNMKE
jgi:hypothetical protein